MPERDLEQSGAGEEQASAGEGAIPHPVQKPPGCHSGRLVDDWML